MKIYKIGYFVICLSYYIYNIIDFDSKYYKIIFTIEKIDTIALNEGYNQLVSINYIEDSLLISDKIQLSMTDRIVVGDTFPGYKLINGSKEVSPYNKYLTILNSSMKFFLYTLFVFILVFAILNFDKIKKLL